MIKVGNKLKGIVIIFFLVSIFLFSVFIYNSNEKNLLSLNNIKIYRKALSWPIGGVSLWNFSANSTNVKFYDLHKINDVGNDGIDDIVVGGYNTTSTDGLVILLNG